MPPGESSHSGGSECVAKGGRGYFRPSYGRPKFTLFSKKKRSVVAVLKKNVSPKIVEIELSNLNHFLP